MARASAKRAKRARAHARNAQRAVAPEATAEAPAAAPAPPEPAPRPARAEPKKVTPKETAPRGFLRRREKKQPQPKRPEDTMFFTRLRTRAKWVFVFLVAIFAIGFLAFGVGAGGTGVGDAIRDFFGGDSGTVSQSDLEKQVADNPADAEAVTQLSALLLQQGQYARATTILESYLKQRPNDATVLQQLAAVYDTRATRALEQANALQSAAINGSFAATAFSFPGSNGFFGALGQSPVDDAQSAGVRKQALELGDQSDSFYAKEVSTYEKLTKLKPKDANLFAQLGAVANQAGDPDKAVTAYEKYLELEPDGSLAQQVKEQLDQLKALEDTNSSIEQSG